MARFQTGYFASTQTMRSTLVHITNDGRPLCGYHPKEHFSFQWCADGIHPDYVTCKECKRRIPKLLRPILNMNRLENRARRRPHYQMYTDDVLSQIAVIDKMLDQVRRRNRALLRSIRKRVAS